MEILGHPYFIVAIVFSIAFEYLYSRKKKLNNFNGYEAFSNLVLIFADKLLSLATGSDGGGAVKWLYAHRLLDLGALIPGSLQLLVSFLAVEFFYYCNHWYHHHTNLGWATHVMHHSPTKFNLTLGYRLGITRMISLGWLVFLPSVIVGLNPVLMAQCLGIVLLIQFFIHTELVPSLGILNLFFNTPTNHRVHHSDDPRDYNRNLGGITMLFDHLFGTYQPLRDHENSSYGMPAIMQRGSIWYEISFRWKKVFSDFAQAPNSLGRLKALFGPPT